MSGKSGIIYVHICVYVNIYIYKHFFYIVYSLESHTPLKIESVYVPVCVFVV